MTTQMPLTARIDKQIAIARAVGWTPVKIYLNPTSIYLMQTANSEQNRTADFRFYGVPVISSQLIPIDEFWIEWDKI